MYRLRMTHHAELRLDIRASVPKRARHEIRRKLFGMLRCGVQPAEDLAVYVRLGDGCTAVCYPSAMGGWVVRTVLPPPGGEIQVTKEGETA